MRIIGGIYKGIKIFESFDKNTRPLKDLVKESILNILEHSKDSRIELKNSLILDLFSGTGSFGLECISRGAAKVYFVENYIQSLEILNKNIKKLKCEKKAIVLNENVPSGILDISHLQFSDDPSQITEVLNVDLVASISEGVGNITGTLTLGKASLRPSTINIRANEIFLTEQDKA